MENQTWSLVEKPKDKKILTNRWVFKIKRDSSGKIQYEARLLSKRSYAKEAQRL